MRRRACVLIALLIAFAAPAAAQPSLLEKLLRIAGITAAPSQLRAPGDVLEGQIWIADVRTRSSRQVTADGDYRSPAFAPDGTIYALRGDRLVRLEGGTATPLAPVAGAVKLVGFDPEAAGELIVLRDVDGGSPLAVVVVETGAIAPIPVDVTLAETRQMVTFIRGDERAYGDVRLFTRAETRQGALRAVEWTDVFLQRGAEPPVNVSMGGGDSSGQPALSPDGTQVAYIKALQ